jgi:hypothetical protein
MVVCSDLHSAPTSTALTLGTGPTQPNLLRRPGTAGRRLARPLHLPARAGRLANLKVNGWIPSSLLTRDDLDHLRPGEQ